MIALAIASAVAADQTDFDAFAKAVEKCDRKVVADTVNRSTDRHSRFLIDAYRQRRAIAEAWTELAERRRRLHGGEHTADTENALAFAAQSVDDRQRALDDLRRLDAMAQDMGGYFRGQYLSRYAGRAS